MKTKSRGRIRSFIASRSAKVVLSGALMGMGLSDVRAAIMWNWISVGEGNTFSGTLTTDGDYSMTLPGSGNVLFTVLSFDSWFLNGTNLVSDEGPFNSNDWQTGDLPVFTEGGPPLVENTINWSRSLQAIDPMNGLTSSGNEAQIATFPGNTSSEPIFSAFLAIHNPGSGVFGSNRIQQDDPFFNLGFTPTSTEFTPVPEPRIYVSFAMIGLSVLFCIRRVRALEQELPSEESG